MSGRVGVHLVTFIRIKVDGLLEQSGTKGNSLAVRSARVLDVEVEMDLLLVVAMRPVGRDMVRRQLYADPPFSCSVDAAVPLLVLENLTAQHARPERVLSVQVGCVQQDHLTNHLHAWTPDSGDAEGICEPSWRVQVVAPRCDPKANSNRVSERRQP